MSIALALAGRPRVLIADEPTTALDVTVQAEILALLRQLHSATGMAIVVITHDWGVVADIAHRAVVMYAGQVVERAAVDNVSGDGSGVMVRLSVAHIAIYLTGLK